MGRILWACAAAPVAIWALGVSFILAMVSFPPGACRAPYVLSYALVWPIWLVEPGSFHAWIVRYALSLCGGAQ